jgi:hypothetical protein
MKESLVQGGAFKYKEKKTSDCCLMVMFSKANFFKELEGFIPEDHHSA